MAFVAPLLSLVKKKFKPQSTHRKFEFGHFFVNSECEMDLEDDCFQLACKDKLTLLSNRFWLMNYLNNYVSDPAKRNSQMAIIFVDLDQYKEIKYTFGHAFSDDLLCSIGRRLSALLREGDNLARLSYGEFIFILDDINHADQIVSMVKNIAKILDQPFELQGNQRHSVQTSIGISVYPQDGRDGDTLLKHADIAKFSTKNGSNSPHLFYHPSMSEKISYRLNVEGELRRAIERDEFILHFQPRVSGATGELVGLEALLRWNHPERGLVQPAEFIAIAEASGLIVPIGRRVIEMACQQIASWKKEKLAIAPISINVSPRQLSEGDLCSTIIDFSRFYGVQTNMLELEITESCITENSYSVRNQLSSFSKMGIKLLLDDFGTGYSSLSHLQNFRMDVIKIDKSFVEKMVGDARGEILVSSIISMAHALNMGTVAEGVETVEQRSLLKSLGCDEIQGYLISRPLSSALVSLFM